MYSGLKALISCQLYPKTSKRTNKNDTVLELIRLYCYFCARYWFLYIFFLFTGWTQKNWTKLLFTILIVWQLLCGFCLTHPKICDCDIEENGFKMALHQSLKWLCREIIALEFLHLFMRDLKWVRSQALSVLHNRLGDQEAHGQWRRCQQTCRQWPKDCCGL